MQTSESVSDKCSYSTCSIFWRTWSSRKSASSFSEQFFDLFRNSRAEVFRRKGVLRNFAFVFCEIFKNTSFHRTPLVAASLCSCFVVPFLFHFPTQCFNATLFFYYYCFGIRGTLERVPTFSKNIFKKVKEIYIAILREKTCVRKKKNN